MMRQWLWIHLTQSRLGRALLTLARPYFPIRLPLGPNVVAIELTNHCPCRCIMCPRPSMKREHGFLSLALLEKALAELSNHDNGVVCLHGFGESLLHPELEQCFALTRKYHQACSLSVNPWLLDTEIMPVILASGLQSIILSLDGHDGQTYEAIRGINRYLLCLHEIRRLLDAKPPFPIYLQFIDFPQYRRYLQKTIRYWKKEKRLTVIVKPLLDFQPPSTASFRVQPRCQVPWRGELMIHWNGNVVPCCNDFDDNYILGNLSLESLDQIWHGAKAAQLRAEFLTGRITNPLCKNCNRLK